MELRDDLKTATAPDGTWTAPSPRVHELWRAVNIVEDRIRRRRLKVVLALAAVAVCFIGFVAGVRITHPRDEADFLLAARAGAPVASFTDETRARVVDDTDTQALVAGISDADLVAEGDFACRWLSVQERAWWNHGTWYDRQGVLDRYLTQTRPLLEGQWGLPGQWSRTRGVVADAAWSQLCGGTWWWHRPHGPRGSGGGADGD